MHQAVDEDFRRHGLDIALKRKPGSGAAMRGECWLVRVEKVWRGVR